MHLFWDQFGSSWWFYAHLAFTVGMFIHAYRSGAEPFWYWVIFLLQPIGAWAYFFAVFMRSFRFGSSISAQSFWQRELSLNELRYRAERTPTVNNRMALAQALMDKGQHAQAIPLLEAVLVMDENYCQAMHELAECHLACAQPLVAVELLQRLLARDSRWSYYRAWRTLIDAQSACRHPDEALKACRELAKMVPTLENKCLLADHLLEHKMYAEVIDLLDQALEDHAYAPLRKRVKNWRWAREANRLLKAAETR